MIEAAVLSIAVLSLVPVWGLGVVALVYLARRGYRGIVMAEHELKELTEKFK